MAVIAIIGPAGVGTRTGNRHTALRWAGLLRQCGHRVSVATAWSGEPCDLLVALHARRSHDAVLRYRAERPGAPLVVALTGTDLYRDLPDSAEARHSLALADRIIVLQEEAPRALERGLRSRVDVVYQSSAARLRHAPPRRGLRIAVVGHLREEKDPFRAVAALARLPAHGELSVVQVGAAMTGPMRREAQRWVAREPRYRWIDSVPHHRALGWIARSHLLVLSSRMEGGANVICEAARIGTPVIASRVAGNVGMLGRGYPGYYPLEDDAALARLLERAADEPPFRRRLARALAARRHLFTPQAERRALQAAVRRALAAARLRR